MGNGDDRTSLEYRGEGPLEVSGRTRVEQCSRLVKYQRVGIGEN